ncbi:peptide/nickel transport system substrate-binding protein [Rhodococcus sp. OAS809]
MSLRCEITVSVRVHERKANMLRRRVFSGHSLVVGWLAFATVTMLVGAGCSVTPPQPSTPAVGATGDPIIGGSARAVQAAEPRALDPAALSNTWTTQGFLGNALYGTLLINDVVTTAIEPSMALKYDTTDGGATFILKLRPGLKFSDGSPLDAAAVKFNWDRLRDPVTASQSIAQAVNVASNEVLDPLTLRSTLQTPNPHFAQSIVNSSMNWIGSPAALAGSPEAFNAKPVGAGPFLLESWTRQDVTELVRNPDYWDAPKPYLDKISLRSANDTNQRINTVIAGGADVVMESNWASLAKARNAGLPVDVVPMSGGQYIAMNSARAPFDDIRARQAVAMAVNVESLNLAVYNGEGEIPESLFKDGTPYYTDTKLSQYNPDGAQALFDELAAEGRPVEFTFTAFSTVENRAGSESVQAQLSAFDNVKVNVETVDFPTGLAKAGSKDFQVIISASNIQDPDYGLWLAFQSKSRGNVSGISDPELDRALATGRYSESTEERKAAYEVVQERVLALTPGIFYVRASPAVVSGLDVGGVHQYGTGSLLPEELWIAD